MVLLPLKCTWKPKLLQVFLNFSPIPFVYGTMMEMFLLLDPLMLVHCDCLCIVGVVLVDESIA